MSQEGNSAFAEVLTEMESSGSGVDFDLHSGSVAGGEPRRGQFTGTRALMLAVFEDGIRCYLSSSKGVALEAECWVHSDRVRSPFAFPVICEMLGLDDAAVRVALRRMRERQVSPRQALPRSRPNVRIANRVRVRKAA